MSASSIQIDVLIPVYNGERWLTHAVRSILDQTHRALRVHVVDDGSTDSSPVLLGALAEEDERVRIYRQPNGGIVSALNHGLRFCSAEFVARHDADDIAHPTRLATQLQYLLDNADRVAVGAVARHIDGEGTPLGTITELRPPDAADANWFPAREPYLMHPLLFVRRKAVIAVGAYRDVRGAEDSDLYWRLQRTGRLHNLDQVLADYRVHGSSISSASITNGRVMAINSQRAALSARRRDAGLADLEFSAADGDRLHRCTTLQEMLELVSPGLTEPERIALSWAVVAKLMELASYQPYALEASDCLLFREVLAGPVPAGMTQANRRSLHAQAARTALSLWDAGRRQDAVRVLVPGALPGFFSRFAMRRIVPASLRRRLHSAMRQGRAA